ncbi:DHA2 family efflux MFS transporter permease subunit [Variovorax sp. PBL-E5]|uniref:DHA2 family efflux MFS transporter permease subunit n=1 Tax=Variovorax sp. PBL-E5 TaxID=434014 RepID=UPI00131779C2|nr:DHA2 family efflux MFS transporter permease subunit [Variovorax sp. PBL-E5]VTU37261.1 Multidrug resistance protein B [Variovorax sp. PBL-E5]
MSAAAVMEGPTAGAPHRTLITLSVILASIMQALDNTIANVALPRIQGSLSATQDQMTWVLTSYIIAAAIMTPLSGWLAGQIGRKRVFLFSVVGFTIASALCGLAQTLPAIVISRLLQGLCGAALIPMSQAVLLDINPPARHARAMAIWAMAVTVGPILGPALGGWLTEHYSWRWVFYINVPFGILSFLGILSFMPETPLRRSRFDFFGFAALSVAIGAFQLMLDRGQIKDWFSSTEICVEAVVAGLALYLFVVHMLTTDRPSFVSPVLFKDRNFLTGNLFIFVVGVVLFATLALLPPLLQDLMNYPVVLTGLVTAPRGFGTLAAMFIVGRVMGRIDTRLIIATGFCLTAFSLWQMTRFYLQMDSAPVVWSGLTQGLGTGFVYVPLAAITFATLPKQYRNEGTALFSLVRNVGSSVGISVVESLLTRNTQAMHSRLAEQVTPFSDILHSQAAISTTEGLAALNQMVSGQAAMIAYNNDFKLMMVLTLCAVPLVLLLRRAAAANKEDAPMVVE